MGTWKTSDLASQTFHMTLLNAFSGAGMIRFQTMPTSILSYLDFRVSVIPTSLSGIEEVNSTKLLHNFDCLASSVALSRHAFIHFQLKQAVDIAPSLTFPHHLPNDYDFCFAVFVVLSHSVRMQQKWRQAVKEGSIRE